MRTRSDLTAEELRLAFTYDPLAGTFRRNFGPRKSCVAGGIDTRGYRQIRIGGQCGLTTRRP